MRILSIDFDYFQKVKADTVSRHYPDGIDLPTDISTLIWSTKYAQFPDLKKSVSINRSELEKAKSLILEQNRTIRAEVAKNHKEIYDFIHDCGDITTPLEVVNIDMHHDVINDNSSLDCGNWIGFLKKEYKDFRLQWVANEISAETYGIDTPEFQKVMLSSVSEIEDKQFDAVFLCRSDNWTAPHMDKYFCELANTIIAHFDRTLVEQGVMDNRFSEKDIQKLSTVYKNITK